MSIYGSALSIGGMILGGIAGSLFGPAGSFTGIAVGATLGGMAGGIGGGLLFPDRPEIARVPPPQPGENRVQVSSYGAPRGLMHATVRKAGVVIKMQPIQESTERSRHRQDGVRYYEYTRVYTSTFAVGFGPGPAAGISRLWVNGQIFYDARDASGTYYPAGSASVALTNLNRSVDRADKYMTIYLGTEGQDADADLVAIFGAAEVPSYKGEIYIVFTDFPVGEYSGLPNIEAEIVMDGSVETEDMVADFTSTYPGLTHHQALDDDENLIKFDATSGRVVIFDGISNVPLSSFAAPNPSGYTFMGLGFDPNTGLIILGYTYTSGSGYGQIVTHYVVNTSGRVVTSWTAPSVYGGGDAGISYAFTTDGMIAHYSTSNYYNFTWYTGSLMVLYESIYGTEIDRVWGPNTTADPTDMDYGRYKPIWGDLPDPTAYWYLGDETQYWKLRWADLVKSGSTFPLGTMPDATKVATAITNTRGTYLGALLPSGGDLITYDTNYDELYVHSGISSTIKQRSMVLESGAGLDDVVTAICAAAGITAEKIDVTALASDSVLGFQVPRVMSARTALETLMRAYSFEVAEIDWKLVFVKLGGSSVVTIPDGDLGAAEGEEAADQPIVETRSGADLDLPSHLLLSYESKTRDYQTAVQPAFRADRPLIRLQNESLGIVMTDTQAKQTAEILLKQIWNRRSFRTPLPGAYNWLAPTDVITARGKDMRIVELTDKNGVVDITARAEPGGTYTSAAVAGDIAFELVDISQDVYIPQVILFAAPALSVDHGQAGCYAAMFAAGTYRGGTLQRSADGGVSWQDVAYFDTTSAKVGQCTAALATGLAGVLDYTAGLTVDMARSGATLSSATDDELANGANLAAVGSEDDGYEIIQFKTASLSSGVYTLTGLLRGLYGTEGKMAGHAVNDDFIVLNDLDGIEFVGIDTALAGETYRYRAKSPSNRRGAAFDFAASLLPILPLPASSVWASRNSSGDCIVAWARGDRYEFAYPDLPDNRDVPMSEVSESYEVDILNPITEEALRTKTATSPTVAYTQANQTADGYPSLALSDDCAGSLATNFTDNDMGTAQCSFTAGLLQLYCPASSNTSGANATAKNVLNRSGKTVLAFSWKFDTATSTSPFGDNATEVVVHKSSPTFASAAWSYGRPEYGVGANSFIALAFHYNSGFYLTVKERISGSDNTVAQVAVTAVDEQWVDIIWQIDWTDHTVTVWMDGVIVIDAAAFASGLDTPITASLQATFRANAYSGNTYYMDDIRIAHNRIPAEPVMMDIYQMSAAAGRGVAKRVSV